MNKPREHWGSTFGFLMAAAGSAIGLGTLWKFPYVTGENGGGAFILVFILCTLLIGVPVFIAELLIGRHTERGAVASFAALAGPNSGWKIPGWLGVISSFLIMCYYGVIAGWGLNYILMSLNQFFINRSPQEIEGAFEILTQSGDISVFWQVLFIAITVGVVYPGIRDGIEYWAKWMTSLLFMIIIALFIYNLRLDGFGEAAQFILTPDFTKLKASSVLEALGLSFFTLSLGQGIMITYGSYMRKGDDIPRTALAISAMIIIVAMLTAFVIFPIIFTFHRPPEGGFGLVFKTLPLLFANLPGSLVISTAFFTLFVFCALTSSIAFVEVIVATMMELYGWTRKRAAIATGISIAIFGLPCALSGTDLIFANWPKLFGKNFFQTIDHLVSVWLLPIGGLLIALFAGWKLQKSVAIEEFANSSLKCLFKPWLFFIKFIAPIAIIMIILQETGVLNFDTFMSDNIFSK